MTEGYLIIDIDASKPLTFKPFKNALTPALVKKGRSSVSDVWCYSFFVDSKDGEFTKIGHTASAASYGSKKRYCPWLTYNGVFQIQTYGNMHEVMLRSFLGKSVDNSEWFQNSRARLDDIVSALDANEHFQRETARVFSNVTPFHHAFTGKAGATATTHLSLYRLRYKGVLYTLDEGNVNKSLREITKLPTNKKKKNESAASASGTKANSK